MEAKNNTKTLGERIVDREDAIQKVYGENNSLIKLSNGETITGWSVEGFSTFDELKDYYSYETAIGIYDSGM